MNEMNNLFELPKAKKVESQLSLLHENTSEKTYTYFNIAHKYKCDSDIIIEDTKILLNQFPEENLILKFSIKSGFCAHCRNKTFHNYSNSYAYHFCRCTKPSLGFTLSFTFKNNLHILTKNYRYEVLCTICGNDKEMHPLSYFVQKQRVTESITFDGTIFDNGHLNHPNELKICFLIRRFRTDQVVTNQIPTISYNEILSNKNFGDISIKIENELIYVHKDVLTARSEVFTRMFAHNMSEKNKKQIVITDCEIIVMKKLLIYMYTNDYKHSYEISMKLYEVAHKYEVRDLEHKCIENIIFNVCLENCVSTFIFAMTYNLHELISSMELYFIEYESTIVKRKDFQTFLLDHLSVQKVAWNLDICSKYPQDLNSIKLGTYQFIKDNIKEVLKNQEFKQLFCSHSKMMEEVFSFVHQD